MNLLQIKAKLDAIDFTNLTQKQAGELIGTTQSDVSRCCRHYGIQWPYKQRDQNGENNHNFQGGMGRSTIERTTRRALITAGRNLFICERCGIVNTQQEHPRHHKDRNRANNTPENLEVLCCTCHMNEHKGERGRDKLGRFTV